MISLIQRIDDTGWQNTSQPFAVYRRVGNIVYLNGYSGGASVKNLNASGDTTIAILPQGYRPSREIHFPICNRGSSSGQLAGTINENGNIIANNGNSGAVGYWVYEVSFPIN